MINRYYFYRVNFEDRSITGVVVGKTWFPRPSGAFDKVMETYANSGDFIITEFVRV